MDGSSMLAGHVDASGVLVAPPPKLKSKSITVSSPNPNHNPSPSTNTDTDTDADTDTDTNHNQDNMFTLFAPFDIALWACIVALVSGHEP